MPRLALAALAALLLSGRPAGAEGIAPSERRSGFDQMSAEVRAMQRDDTANPGMLAVADGAELWASPPTPGKPPCAGCHGEAQASMRGVAARYPAWDAREGRPIDLQGRINQCRRDRQGADPLAYESPDLLALTAFVATQSRGAPISPPDDARLDPARAEGRALFEGRMGQLGLSCAICHDESWGRRLGSAVIPQGQPTGYPLYRLEWQGIGSLQRRLRNCLSGMRAEPFAYGAPEYVALELYLATRAAPLPLETPAVRPDNCFRLIRLVLTAPVIASESEATQGDATFADVPLHWVALLSLAMTEMAGTEPIDRKPHEASEPSPGGWNARAPAPGSRIRRRAEDGRQAAPGTAPTS